MGKRQAGIPNQRRDDEVKILKPKTMELETRSRYRLKSEGREAAFCTNKEQEVRRKRSKSGLGGREGIGWVHIFSRAGYLGHIWVTSGSPHVVWQAAGIAALQALFDR